MPWQDTYRHRLTTPADAVCIVEDSDRVVVPLSEQPLGLLRALAARAHSVTQRRKACGNQYWYAASMSWHDEYRNKLATDAEGLPIGVQVIARPWREDVSLALALLLKSALGGWQKPAL